MSYTKITTGDRAGKGVTGLSNTPGLSTSAIQERFDSLANLSIDKFNNHVDELEADLATRPTNASMESAIDARVIEIGAGDMAQATYDPQHKRADVFAAVAAADGKGVQLYTCATTASAAAGTAYYTDAACTRQATTLRTLAEPTAVTASGSVYTFSVSGTAYYVTAASVTAGVAAAGSAVYTDAACTQQATDPCTLTEAKTATGHTGGNYAFASGGTAYYLKAADVTGVTHALTGAGENIKFLPDAPYTGGAFTVNGSAVTPKTQAGETPESGLFAAGCMVQAFLHGAQLDFKAAGAGLILRLVGGTTAPASAAEYTVWANTSVAVGAVTWAATAPASPADGDVWVQLGTSAAVPIPIDSAETAWIYPVAAKQYISGAWVVKDAETYKNGVWVLWVNFLYSPGDEHTSVTGGWQCRQWAGWSGCATNLATVENTDTALVIQATGVSASVCEVINDIDLTGIDTLVFDGSATAEASTYLYVGNRSATYYTDGAAASLTLIASKDAPAFDGTASLDVSALTGSYDVFFSAYTYSAGALSTITVRNLKME